MSILFNVRHEAEDVFPPIAPWTDTFTGTNGDAPNELYWEREVTSDWERVTIQNNECNFDSDGTTSYITYMKSLFNLTGDFDVTFDFNLYTFGTGAGGSNYVPLLYVLRADTSAVMAWVGREYSSVGVNGYGSDGNIVAVQEIAQADSSGKIRIQRGDPNPAGFYVSYWKDGAWEWNGNPAGRLVGSLTGVDMRLRLLWLNKAGNDVECSIDNFKVNSGTPVAP